LSVRLYTFVERPRSDREPVRTQRAVQHARPSHLHACQRQGSGCGKVLTDGHRRSICAPEGGGGNLCISRACCGSSPSRSPSRSRWRRRSCRASRCCQRISIRTGDKSSQLQIPWHRCEHNFFSVHSAPPACALSHITCRHVAAAPVSVVFVSAFSNARCARRRTPSSRSSQRCGGHERPAGPREPLPPDRPERCGKGPKCSLCGSHFSESWSDLGACQLTPGCAMSPLQVPGKLLSCESWLENTKYQKQP